MRTRQRRALSAAFVLAVALGVGLWRLQPNAPAASIVAAAPAQHPSPGGGSAAAVEPHSADRTPGGSDRTPGARAPAAGWDVPLDERALDSPAEAASAAEEDGEAASDDWLGSSQTLAGPRAIYLNAYPPPEGAVSTRIEGLDTGAPRALVLWRLRDGRRIRVAAGESSVDGALHFPEVLVPDRPLELVVTAAESGPAGLDRSAPAVVARGAPVPPQLLIGPADARGLAIRVAAAEGVGNVVLARANGQEIGRFALSRHPDPARRVFDIRVDVAPGDGPLLVAHELPDGERSAWRAYPIPPPPAPPAAEEIAAENASGG